MNQKLGYRQEDGTVVLRLTPDDYTRLMMLLRDAALRYAKRSEGVITLEGVVGLMNRLNEGRPDFRPYKIDKVPGAGRGFA